MCIFLYNVCNKNMLVIIGEIYFKMHEFRAHFTKKLAMYYMFTSINNSKVFKIPSTFYLGFDIERAKIPFSRFEYVHRQRNTVSWETRCPRTTG